MNKIKILALDLDGTLTNSNKEVSENNKKAIKYAQEKDVKIVLASGRPVIGIKKIADELDLWSSGGYILAYNGGHIIDCKTNTDIVKDVISFDYVHEICDIINHFEAFPLTYDEVGVICESNENKYVKKEAFNNGITIRKVVDLQREIHEPVVKFMIVGEPVELQKVYRYLIHKFENVLNIFFSEPYFLEITPLGIEKASSLKRLLQYLQLDKECLMACGDGLNDIPMLEFAGLSIAMDNAYEETKKFADFISKSNNDDGVAFAIKRFIY